MNQSNSYNNNNYTTNNYKPLNTEIPNNNNDYYGTYNPNSNRTFNQFTSIRYDTCTYENELRIGSKPMKYYVNQLNSPQVNPFTEFTVIGNQKQYNVRNDFERPIPSRLNPIYPSYVLPYSTTPFLANQNPSREYTDTETFLRFGAEGMREKQSSVALGEVDYDRWEPSVSAVTVQNAGQFNLPGGKIQSTHLNNINPDGYYNHNASNTVLFANSAWPYFGISSRNQLRNAVELNNC